MTDTNTGYFVYTDGGARGNPGPAAYGFVIYNDMQEVVVEGAAYLGILTNNQAEYQGLIHALEALVNMGQNNPVTIHMDSQLIVRQVKGLYRVKHPDLLPLYEKAIQLLRQYKGKITVLEVPREQNKHADRLVNQAMDGVERNGTD